MTTVWSVHLYESKQDAVSTPYDTARRQVNRSERMWKKSANTTPAFLWWNWENHEKPHSEQSVLRSRFKSVLLALMSEVLQLQLLCLFITHCYWFLISMLYCPKCILHQWTKHKQNSHWILRLSDRNFGLITGSNRRFHSSPNCPNQLWHPLSYLFNEYRTVFPYV